MANLELKNIERSDYYYREAIKTLRTNLQFCGSSVKVIMFTSTMPAEGKSSTLSLTDLHPRVSTEILHRNIRLEIHYIP